MRVESIKSMSVTDLVRFLSETDHPPSARSLIEASLHLPTRSTVVVASYRNKEGRQIQRTTAQRDRASAQVIDDEWEAQAKKNRPCQAAKPGKRNPKYISSLSRSVTGRHILGDSSVAAPFLQLRVN